MEIAQILSSVVVGLLIMLAEAVGAALAVCVPFFAFAWLYQHNYTVATVPMALMRRHKKATHTILMIIAVTVVATVAGYHAAGVGYRALHPTETFPVSAETRPNS